MKCKKCGGNVIDIIEKQLSIITPIGQNEMKIQELLKQAKPCWKYAAMDWDLKWYFFSFKPKQGTSGMWILGSEKEGMDFIEKRSVSHLFDIEPFDGDWKDSLIEREEYEF